MGKVIKLREFNSYVAILAMDAPPSSTQGQMDAAILRLREGAKSLAKLPLEQRVMLLDSMQQGFLRVARSMVEAGCKAKGIELGTTQEAEEWSTGPWGVVHPVAPAARIAPRPQTFGEHARRPGCASA